MDIDWNSYDIDSTPKIPSLLSSHLDSPLRIHMIEYVEKHKSLIMNKEGIQGKHPKAYGFFLKDVHFLYENNHITDHFNVINASSFGLLFSSNISINGHINSQLQLENTLMVALRNFELQITKIITEDNSDGMLDPSQSNMKDNLLNIIHNKQQFCKEMPFMIRHFFSWYKTLYQAVVMTGDPNEFDENRKDFENLNESWIPIFPDSKMYIGRFADISIIISRNILIIQDKEGAIWMGTREHLLQLTDIFIQRFNLMMSGWIAEKIGFQHYLYPNELLALHSWGDKLLSVLHNKAFDILSKWEPLCLGSILKFNPDPICNNSEFLSNIQQDIIDDFSDSIPDISDRLIKLESYLYKLYKKSPHKLSQSFGLYRTWGHPNIDPKIGILKLKQIACQKRVHNHKTTQYISCIFKERFSLNYRAKKGCWPKMNVEKLPPTNIIRRAYETNSTLGIVSKEYNIHDWEYINFEKTFEIVDKLNISDLISDKAMSLGIDELFKQVFTYGNIGLATDKAVIVQWLKSNLNDPIKFLEMIDKYGFGENERIFGVCPKERELKIVARFFGLSTLLKRMYIVLTEAMIAEFIIPFFPEITMMDDHITLSKKFFEQTRNMDKSGQKSSSNTINVVINIDFQKWNTYMRELETFFIFQAMDHLFGLNRCISRTHEMFSLAQLYLADGTYIPRFTKKDGKIYMVEDDFVWSEHDGGIEGLRQKGWTVFTICVLIAVLLKFNYRFSLMGQGDNQVLIIHFPAYLSVETIKAELKRILEELEKMLKLIGPPLKKEETWCSSNLFAYGKVIILNGCPLSMSQKKLCRMFPMSNEGFPTVETAISSISANCSSACASDFNPIIPYIMHNFWNISILKNMLSFSYLGYSIHETLLNNPDLSYTVPGNGFIQKATICLSPRNLKVLKTNDKDFLLSLSLFPKILGGFPISFLSQYLIKSFPDPLTECLAILFELYSRLSIQEERYIKCILNPHINSHINMEYLFSNPTGINLRVPTTPGDIVKSTITRFIQGASWIKNDYVREFLQFSEKNQDLLVETLSTMNPLNPIVGHEILDSTVTGRAKGVVDQLNKTGTLVKIAAKNGDNLLRRVQRAEINYIKSVIYNLFTMGNYEIKPSQCSRIEAQRLRVTSWGNPNLTGVTVPYPTEFLVLNVGIDCDDHNLPEKGYILSKQNSTSYSERWLYGEIIGASPPYIGSKTKDKVKSYGKQIARNSSPLIKKASNLQTLIGWASEYNSNLSNCIRRLFSAVTDLPPELLNPSEDSISGSLEHRLSTTSLDRGGKVELLFTFATHLTLSTDTFVAYAKGTENVNIHFQAAMSYIVSLFSTIRSLDIGFFNTCYHFHQKCIDCIIPINEDKLDITAGDWNLMIPSYPNSTFCWVSKEKLLKDTNNPNLHYPLFPADHPLKFNHKWTQLRACRSAARETMIKIRNQTIEIGDGKQISISGWIFPVAWVFKLDPYVFFLTFYLELFSYYLLRQFEIKMVKNSFQDLQSNFNTFLVSIDDGFFGLFSSWFQNNSFMDYICGAPFFLRPPLTASITKRACGNCIKRLMLSILQFHEEDLINKDLLENWEISLTTGEEALDSNPILMSLVYRYFMDISFLQPDRFLRIYLSMKSFIPNFIEESETVLLNMSYLLRSNYRLIRNSLTEEDLNYLMKHLNSIKIFRIVESTDGLISKLPSFNLKTKELQSLDIKFNSLPISTHEIHMTEMHFLSIPHILELDEASYLDLPEVSLENHLLKPINFPTTSSYKLLSIIKRLGPIRFKHREIGCFGDGAGGFTRLMLMISDKKVFYNSKIDISTLFPNALGNGYPPCLAGYPSLRSRLFGTKFTYEMMNDLTDPEYANSYINNVKIPLGTIICDAEGKSKDNILKSYKILINLLKIAEYSKSDNFLFKTYFYDWNEFINHLTIIKELFSNITIFRSRFSSRGSTEVYVYATKITLRYERMQKIKTITNETFSNTVSYSCDGSMKEQLCTFINNELKEYESDKYTRCLTLSIYKYHSQVSLFSLSPKLHLIINQNEGSPKLEDKDLYRFPYHYLSDCKKNTHLLKFVDKYHKITKTNFITKSFARRVCTGYLVLILNHENMTFDKFSKIWKEGAILFYNTVDHFWNFIICNYKKLKNIKEPKFSLEEIFSKKHKKEILIKASIFRAQIIKNIRFDIDIDIMPHYLLIKEQGQFLFHYGMTPLDIPKNPIIGILILKLDPSIYEPPFQTHLKFCQNLWVSNRIQLMRSQYWIYT